jgi:hypothetical protein
MENKMYQWKICLDILDYISSVLVIRSKLSRQNRCFLNIARDQPFFIMSKQAILWEAERRSKVRVELRESIASYFAAWLRPAMRRQCCAFPRFLCWFTLSKSLLYRCPLLWGYWRVYEERLVIGNRSRDTWEWPRMQRSHVYCVWLARGCWWSR